MDESTLLTNVWACILAFAVLMYVVMDGFDLGIGILFPVFGVGRDRDTAMNSIAQHAVTNGYGKSENFRAHPISSSLRVAMYSNVAAFSRGAPVAVST